MCLSQHALSASAMWCRMCAFEQFPVSGAALHLARPRTDRGQGHVQDQQNPAWCVRHRGAWVGGSFIRKSQTSTFQMTESTCQGRAQDVVGAWEALGFKVRFVSLHQPDAHQKA